MAPTPSTPTSGAVAPNAEQGALGPYLAAIRAHWVTVAVCILAAFAGSVLWLSLRTPDYSASAQMLVTPLPQDDDTFLGIQLIRDSGDPTRTIQTAATLIEIPAADELTARKMGDGYTASSVGAAIEVQPQGESNIIDITATAPDPDEAAKLANTFAESALETRRGVLRRQVEEQIARVEARQARLPSSAAEETVTLAEQLNALESVRDGDDPTLTISQSATAPGAPDGLSSWMVVVLALIAGTTLGAAAAVLMELASRTVRDEAEAVSRFPMPVLTRVPRVSQRALGISAPGDPWQMPPTVHEAFRTLIAQLDDRGREDGRTAMVSSACSGEGKTSTAINLAVSLATTSRSVILLDLDLRKPDVGTMLGIEDRVPLSEIARVASGDNGHALEDLLVPAPHLPSLHVLPTAIAPGQEWSVVESVNLQLVRLIRAARRLADHVIVDTAPLGQVSDALRIVGEADDLLIVTRPGHVDRRNFDAMRDLLVRTGHLPTGMVLIGDAPSLSRTYYGRGGESTLRQRARQA